MKITNITTGKSYQLFPDTKLKIERTNPFFNEYGEQTEPVTIPDNEYNERILNYPGIIQRKNKVTMFDVTIQDGEYFNVCRQAILNVSKSESIETSFYLNEGSFYSKLDNIYITDIFSGEKVDGINSLDEAISYLKNIVYTGGNEMFSIFQVKIISDSAKESRYLNEYDIYNGGFVNEKETTEVVSGKEIHVPKGFYLTPFLKVNYVLKRVFKHFGYDLEENFFTQTPPFPDMVFINNVADTIVGGSICIEQLLPKITCSKLFELIRKKFNAEFIVNEIKHTAKIVLFNEIASEKPSVSLSSSLANNLSVKFPDSYKSIVIESEDSLSEEQAIESIPLLVSQYPTAQFDPVIGRFFRTGFHLTNLGNMAQYNEIIAGTGQRYYESGKLDTYEVKIPECIPSSDLYIGEVQYLNSSLMVEGASVNETNESIGESENPNMYTMLAFSYSEKGSNRIEGSITGYIYRKIPGRDPVTIEFSDYALIYNGPKGIFERFYRNYDTLLRNSLHEVSANLLLTPKQKQDISPISIFEINGIKLILNKLSYSISGKNDLCKADFYTTELYEPIDQAKTIEDILNDTTSPYKWIAKDEYEEITEEEYNNSPYKDVNIEPIFPDIPKYEYIGKKYFERYRAYSTTDRHGATIWIFRHYWLEVVKA